MKYTTRQQFPAILPEHKTQYCWQCGAPGAEKTGIDPVVYHCAACGKDSERVLIYDPNMQMYFDDKQRLVHESCGVILTRSDGKLLLFKRTKFPYLLTIPAGHLEQGEEAKSCAARETEEEIGIHPQQLTKIFEGNIEGDSCLGGADIHHWNAYVAVVNDVVQPQLDAEGSSWGWYDTRELNASNSVQPLLYLLAQAEVADTLRKIVGRN